MDDDQKEFSSPRNLDSAECRFDRDTHSVNITGQSFPHGRASTPMSFDLNLNLNSNTDNNNNNNTVNGNNTPVPVQNYPSFRDHIKSKASLAETFMKNLSRNNNNNNSNNNLNTINDVSDTEKAGTENFSILQANSKKILDSTRKHHKYLAKRKILMHYNEELNEKRRKEMEKEKEQQSIYGIQHDANNNQEALEPITTITTIENSIDNDSNLSAVPKTPTTPTTPSNNNIKLRLLANHLNNNVDHQEADNAPEEDAEVEEEQALNLAQNAPPIRHEKIIPNIELVKIEPESSEFSENVRHNINNNDTYFEDEEFEKHEDNDNNNNTIETMQLETDPNNNNNSSVEIMKSKVSRKHEETSGLLNIINRNVHIGLVDNNSKGDYDLETESDNNNNNNKHNNNNNQTRDEQTNDNNNNNNHSKQLHLSSINSVKNIATAEILCGLKSKVFKMEKEREACRNRNEIPNAE